MNKGINKDVSSPATNAANRTKNQRTQTQSTQLKAEQIESSTTSGNTKFTITAARGNIISGAIELNRW